MSFNDIFCQNKAVDTLQRAFVADRAAHAYIFAGPAGVGKFKTANEWGRLLLCSRPVITDNHAEACGLCEIRCDRACQDRASVLGRTITQYLRPKTIGFFGR